MSEAKSVLVSAGASGIGKAIAKAFATADYAVHVSDISEKAIADLKRELPQITTTVADMSVPEDVDRVFDGLAKNRGSLDVLVNNVGIAGPTASVEEIDPADWDRTIAVDLSAHFYSTRRAVPLLKRISLNENKKEKDGPKSIRGGSILNIASTAALFGFPLRSPYAAAKWAIVGLTKTWAMELGEYGIRVNALCPGSVEGPRIDSVIERDAAARNVTSERVRDVYLRQNSMRVFVDPEDIANTAVFLTSDKGRHISGQAIGIDGHTEGLSNWLS